MSVFDRRLLRKVPEVTLVFWAIKLLSTALGESTSDYLVNTFNPYAVVILGFIGFIAVLLPQFIAKKYIPWLYWSTVTMVAVFGTMAADVIHVALGVPYIVSTIALAVILLLIFRIWAKTEGTLSIHSITTTRRELFYWLTVSTTFALGTAAGDLLAYTAQLGFFSAGLVFAVLFLIPAIAYKGFNANVTLTFWTAYIFTRPLGASFADWTGKATAVGGLGWGDGLVSAALIVAIIALVIFLQITHEDVDRSPSVA